ncbi:hypothetical protein EB001_20950, partial [bacterium]|nr:hypothetical protein [bacterium]
GCSSLTELPVLPDGITYLNLCGCSSLTELPALPDSITYLILHECSSLTELPALPAGITDLSLSGCSSLTRLPALPDSISYLNLHECSSLTELPALPAGIYGATGLNISRCSSLTRLPALPAGITDLNLYGCSSLTELPVLPAGIDYLDITGCSSLNIDDNFFQQIIRMQERGFVHIRGLDSLNIDDNFFQQMMRMQERGVRIHGLEVNDIMRRQNQELYNIVKDSYRAFYHGTDEAAREPTHQDRARFPTLTLIDRILQESLANIEGGVNFSHLASLRSKILPFVEALRADPSMFKIIDETSSGYLAACVNQPLAGFTEIANLVHIKTLPDIYEKIQAMRVVMACEEIKSNVRAIVTAANIPHVEVELVNAMLREVNTRLSPDQRWPGVPEIVPHQATIQQHLTEENIARISGIVKERCFDIRDKMVADFACNSAIQDFWASVTLAEGEKQALSADETRLKGLIIEAEEREEEDPTPLYEEFERAKAKCRKDILAASEARTFEAIAIKQGQGASAAAPDPAPAQASAAGSLPAAGRDSGARTKSSLCNIL